MNARPPTFALLLIVASASAQESEPQRVVITGSRVPRVDAEKALPVQVIGREEIERSGVRNAEELLDRVSANFGGHPEALGLGDGDTPGLSGASLRGLGTGETLVLLNGRRLANYAFTGLGGPGVDLHVIPLAAIDRVEILKDGASALYGSDAIAGVINFVTRQDYAGAEVSLNHGAPEAGGGEFARATLAAGYGDVSSDGFNIFGILDVQDQKRLRAVDRPFAATGFRPELGLDSTVATSWPANIRLVSDGRFQLVNPAAPACTPLTVNVAGACWFDFAKTLELLPPSQQANLLGRGTLRLAPDAEAYAEVLAARSRMQFNSSASPAAPSVSQNGARFRLPESSPYYPTELGLSGDLQLAYRTQPLGSRSSEVESDNARVLAGMRWRWAGWDIDGALSANASRARERYVSGYVDAGRLSAAMATGLVNPFGLSGPEGDALLASTQLQGPSRESTGRTQVADLRASRDLAKLAGGALAMATGIEARHESLVDKQLPIVADVIGGVPSAPKEGARHSQAAYVELVAPLARGLEVQAAARVDHYSDFGTEVSPKIALRLQPVREWLFRASAGKGFRAPSLPELYTQQESGFAELAIFDVSDPVRCPVTGLPQDCMPEVLVTTGGNPALQPQKSVQANVGMVFEPPGGWMASVDFWAVRVEDIIGSLSFEEVVNNIPRYEGRNVIRGPVDPAFPDLPGPITGIMLLNENLGDWRVSGADLAVALRPAPTALGRVTVALNGTYVRHARQNIFEGNAVDLIGQIVPRWQHVLSASLDRGAWNATLSQRYRHGYEDTNPLPDGSMRRVASYRVWDAQLVYAMTRDTKVALDVHNLLDTDPPFTNGGSGFQVGYDARYADPRGRSWALTLRWAWQ